MFQLSLWSISPLLTALVVVGSYRRLKQKPRVPGTDAMLALFATVLFWSGCRLLQTIVTDHSAKVMLVKLSYVAIALVPVLWFVFAIGFTRRQKHLSRRLLNFVGALPAVSVGLAMTNEWHGLLWAELGLIEMQGYVGLTWSGGPWLYVQAFYAYALVGVATTILAYGLSDTGGAAKPVAGVIMAPLIVSAATFVDLAAWNPAPWFDFTTPGFALAALTLNYAVLETGVMDNIPVLRHRVVEQLTEGVVVVSGSGRIIDINQAALTILGMSPMVLHQHIDDFLPNLNVAALVSGAHGYHEVALQGRSYDVTGSRLDPTDPASDVVLTFRDVTVRRDAELALRNAQQELRKLAHTDSLTGLHNRRLFMNRMEEEIQRVQRYDSCLSVVMLDLDHFKQVNDGHGHDAGDRVLQAVADRLVLVKRASDVAARVGGEEFALLLPQTDHAGAMHLAQRLRSAIEAIDTVAVMGTRVTVTASFGLATVTGNAGDPTTILKRADDALYQAKRGGRNQVCAAG
jgi:diguanylate cyclase (GGDEF)-like protein